MTEKHLVLWKYCVFPFLYLCNLMPYQSNLRTLMAPAFVLLEVFVLFRDKWYTKLLLFFLVALCELVCEIVVPGMLMTAEEVSAGLFTLPAARQLLIYVLDTLLYILLLIGVSVAWKSVQKSSLWSIPGRTWAVWFVFPISQFFLMIRWVVAEGRTQFGPLTIIIAAFACVAANIALLMNIRRTADLAMVTAQNTVLKEQIASQKTYYAALTEQYTRVKKMRHDINNHIFTVQALLERNRTEEAKEYLHEVEKAQERSRGSVPCDHSIAAAFLEGRKESMAIEGIQFECSAMIPYSVSIADLDLITALGNLCDNAQEACSAAENDDKTVRMDIHIKDGYLFINVTNPVSASGAKQKRIPELERGLGSRILKELAEKYDGEYSLTLENGRCTAVLILKLGEELDAQNRIV